MLATSVFLVRNWHRRCFSLAAMDLNSRLKKLREDKKQIIERLRQEEAKASTRQRKAETRAKISGELRCCRCLKESVRH